MCICACLCICTGTFLCACVCPCICEYVYVCCMCMHICLCFCTCIRVYVYGCAYIWYTYDKTMPVVSSNSFTTRHVGKIALFEALLDAICDLKNLFACSDVCVVLYRRRGILFWICRTDGIFFVWEKKSNNSTRMPLFQVLHVNASWPSTREHQHI